VNGAESIVRTLVDSDVSVCFGNPGTSEMHFVSALDSVPEMRAVLGLFEGVVTGAADGYARMAGKPACTLLHLGPGFANGIANLHNARRAASPIVNIVGDHATYHAQYDAPLASDIEGLARPVSAWFHSTTSARNAAQDVARAVHAACQPPGQIATLVLPADTAWLEAEKSAPPLARARALQVSGKTIERAAKALRSGKKAAILIRGEGLLERGLIAAGRIAAATGARLLCDTFAPRLQAGAGRVAVERLPYFAEQLVVATAGLEALLLVGAKPPVAFFAYPGKPSWPLPDGCAIETLAYPHEDGTLALEALADLLGATAHAPVATLERAELPPSGPLDQFSIGRTIARFLPDNAIVSDESATSRIGLAPLATAAPHDILSLTGGSIGSMIPVGTGAAVACPDRKVVCTQGDGGAMYTLQALWTQAREKLDVTTVIYANRSYAILNVELMRVGATGRGPKALSMLDLDDPSLDWVKLAEGMGVEASRAETSERFAELFADAMKSKGPRLIEAVI
jgi:acetolactate synthase-1/2/3 large subunit